MIPNNSNSGGSLGQRPAMLHLRVAAGTGGGPEKTILNSPRFIKQYGYEASVVYLCPPADSLGPSLLERAQAAQCPLTVLPDRGPLDLRLIPKLWKICRKRNIQLLQAHDYKSNLIGLILRRLHRCHLATMLHGWTDMTGRMPLYKKVDQWCLPFYQTLICVSEDLVEECQRLGIPERKIHLVRNAIDTQLFRRRLDTQAAKLQVGARTDRWLIGSVGRLSPEKRFADLIECVVALNKQGHAIDLWIAGDGPQRAELEAQIAALNCSDSVRLLGQLRDTIPFYQAMDLFVLNSIREGLPNVILEAMALEVPVIATNIAGIPTLIRHEDTGVLIEPGQPQQLSQAIAYMRSSDTREIARRARYLIETQYSFDSRMQRVAAIYDAARKISSAGSSK